MSVLKNFNCNKQQNKDLFRLLITLRLLLWNFIGNSMIGKN